MPVARTTWLVAVFEARLPRAGSRAPSSPTLELGDTTPGSWPGDGSASAVPAFENDGCAHAAPPTYPPPPEPTVFDAAPVSAPVFCAWMKATTAASLLFAPAYPGNLTVVEIVILRGS